nr:MAG TPA: hypothetical protein [Caudoviricetes sp.]
MIRFFYWGHLIVHCLRWSGLRKSLLFIFQGY